MSQPNLSAFFKGSRSQYYALYECTVKAVKQLDADLRVGGPATSNYVPDTRFDDDWEDMEIQKQLAKVFQVLNAEAEPRLTPSIDRRYRFVALATGLGGGLSLLVPLPHAPGGFYLLPSVPHRLGSGYIRSPGKASTGAGSDAQ